MRERESNAWRALAPLVAVAFLALPAPSGAAGAGDGAGRVASLAAEERSLVLELYALDTRLERARSRLAFLRSRREALEREQARELVRLQAARGTLASARARLAAQVRALYLEGSPDPLAVLLGAGSLDEAMDSLDSLDRAAIATAAVLRRAREARGLMAAIVRSLEERRRGLALLERETAAKAADLAQARRERAAYLERVRRERRASEQDVRRAAARARAARAAATLETERAEAAPQPAEPAVVDREEGAGAGRVLTVLATAYALPGTTSTGLPVGPGVVAVDPTVIPLGTRLSIPGYGEGVAADTGPAIRGSRIDVWVPTRQQALAWGWRTVTVVLEG